jgi:hypothetical protein
MPTSCGREGFASGISLDDPKIDGLILTEQSVLWIGFRAYPSDHRGCVRAEYSLYLHMANKLNKDLSPVESLAQVDTYPTEQADQSHRVES